MTRHIGKEKKLFSTYKIKALFLILLFLFINNYSYSEIFYDENNDFLLDLPENFQLQDSSFSDYERKYLLKQKGSPVQLIINTINNSDYKDSAEALLSVLFKLEAEYTIDSFLWNNKECYISDFSFNFNENFSGWAICAPLKNSQNFIVTLCYTPSEEKQNWEQMIMSTLNGLCVDIDNLLTPGPILSYAYPRNNKTEINFKIANKNITSSIDKDDIEASKFLIDLEFAVFLKYSKQNNWQNAWTRFYQMIYKDSYGRLENVYYDIIENIAPIAIEKNPHNSDIEFAQMILTWVQGFKYERDFDNADFTPLTAAICGIGNDCDSRSLLVSSILKAAGFESFILISNEYNHAMTCFESQAPGQKYIPAGSDREFIMGETTAFVTWGKVPQEYSNKSKWIPVFLP